MGMFDEIPDDPELAFLYLEKQFHEECQRAVEVSDERFPPTGDYLRYISRTLAARTELGIDALSE